MGDERKYIQVSIPESTFTALLRMASMLGDHPSDLGGKYIERGLAEAVKSVVNPLLEQDDPELLVWLAFYRARKKSQSRGQLRQIARHIIQSGMDEDEMENFKSLCEGMEVTPQEIFQEAQAEEAIVGGFVSLDQGPVLEARNFLLEILSGGKEIPSTRLEALARQRGISKSSLKAARAQLRVVSTNAGKQWTCSLPLSMQIPPSIDIHR